ncbi:MAG: insulinase family protein [Anaerolineae bacterium]|nr:insulinase family protein [Gemmatimonadaceae bacterium]
MKRVTCFLALVFVATAASLQGQRESLARLVRQEQLANGLTLIVSENHVVPLATVAVVVRTGAFTQEASDAGISHLYEHMLFRSYRGGEGGWDQEVGALNGTSNGSTSAESVNYYMVLPSRHVGTAIEMLARLVRDAYFDNNSLTLERKVVLGEIERNLAEPLHHLQTEVAKSSWGSSFSRKDPLGTPESLKLIESSRLKEVFQRYYVPNNAALIVTGDVDAAQIFSLASKSFEKWKRGPDPFIAHPVPAMAPLQQTKIAIIQADTREVTVMLQWPGPSVETNTAATYSADLFSSVLNAAGSSFQVRLVGSGLFQSVSIDYETLRHLGPITLTGVTTAPDAERALTALLEEMYKFEGDYFTDQDLAIARKRLKVASVFALEQTAQRAHTIGYWWSVSGLDYYLSYVDNLGSRSANDLREFATKYIVDKPMSIGVLVSPGEAPMIRAAVAKVFGLTGGR